MSSISSVSAQQYSPLQRLQDELTSEVQAGTISSADQSAISQALSSIDQSLQADKASGGGKPPSHGDMKAKIESLISDQVSSGALTSDQASELSNVFANAFKGGPHGAGGPPPGPPPGDGTQSACGTDSDDSSSASSTSSTTSDISQLMQDFLKTLQDAQGSSSYSTSGNSLNAQIQSLIVNYQA